MSVRRITAVAGADRAARMKVMRVGRRAFYGRPADQDAGPSRDRSWAMFASAGATRQQVEQLNVMGWTARTLDGRPVMTTMPMRRLMASHVYAGTAAKARRRAANQRARSSRKGNR